MITLLLKVSTFLLSFKTIPLEIGKEIKIREDKKIAKALLIFIIKYYNIPVLYKCICDFKFRKVFK